jgi:hypothetical protein
VTVIQQSTQAEIAHNAGWGGNAQITAAGNSVGAYPLTNPSSKDSALIVTLPPAGGGYSVQVGSASGASGTALVEVYEMR